ncbi:MAG: hypothetical protein ABFS39_13240 [Pseudomonadota bacterium]
MIPIHSFVLLVLILLSLTGCGLAVKTAVDTARGGTSDLLVVESVHNLRSYDSLDIMPFTNAIGGRLSPKLLAYLNDRILDDLSENGLRKIGEKQLRVSGTVLHLTDDVFQKNILVQVRFEDAATGQSIGLVNVTGQTNSVRGLDAGVDAVANGIVELLTQHHFLDMDNPS